MQVYKVIRISEETYNNLKKQKIRKTEGIDGIIARLIREQGFEQRLKILEDLIEKKGRWR